MNGIYIVLQYFSYYNVTKNKSEEFYHAFTLGLFVNLMDTYDVRSEPESGYGRTDLLLIPYDKSKRGLNIELKRLDEEDDQDIGAAAQSALDQIEAKQYATELIKVGVATANIVKIGIGFQGKECKILISR